MHRLFPDARLVTDQLPSLRAHCNPTLCDTLGLLTRSSTDSVYLSRDRKGVKKQTLEEKDKLRARTDKDPASVLLLLLPESVKLCGSSSYGRSPSGVISDR